LKMIKINKKYNLGKSSIPGENPREYYHADMDNLPAISIVIIGLNVEKYLKGSIDAIMNSSYPASKLEIIYVDSGSNDNSLEIARNYENINILELDRNNPSAAKGRNAGFKAASHGLIQFVDADSYLEKDWLASAVKYINPYVAAVSGVLRERYPMRNIYHEMTALDWKTITDSKHEHKLSSKIKTFGGNVLIRSQFLKTLNGYDEDLKAGEDPDLSYRLRANGYNILKLNLPMASHDIGLDNFKQFWQRTRRSGRVYARLALKYGLKKEHFMVKELVRILAGILIPVTLIMTGILSGKPVLGIVFALLFASRLIFKTGKFSAALKISKKQAFKYSLYLGFAVYPQFTGVIDVLISNLLKYKQFLKNFFMVNKDQNIINKKIGFASTYSLKSIQRNIK